MHRSMSSIIRKNQNVAMVVLTGGPCSGKTTSLSHVKKHLLLKNYVVYTIPEIPTFVVVNGGS